LTSIKKVNESFTTMTEMVMPNDTNPLHNLMGGNLMKWMDIVAAVCAGKHCESHVVTASVDNISFRQPIPIGHVVTMTASVTRAFSTSVEVYVEVFSADIKGGNSRKSNDAYLTFVGVDDTNLKPIPVPQVLPLTEAEQQRYNSALRRRELRLILSGRMKPDDSVELKALFQS
jgi:acyl-CoA hydrolase